MGPSTIGLSFEGGTLLVSGRDLEQLAALPGCRHDPRTNICRAEARHYRAIVEHLRRQKLPYQDEARVYEPTPWPLRTSRDPFPHQTEALDAWWHSGGRGVVVLPTGTGKTHMAILAINRTGRPALVVTPTIDLLNQWYGELLVAFDVPVGLIGGGEYDIQPMTVTTYDSAYIHLERWGNRFGLIVFDECHHLPGPTYMAAAIGSIAPFRLGLTATLERADGQEVLLPELIGPVVYRREIKQLAGEFLAEYRTERIYVELSAEEQERYGQAREQYRRFVEEHRISLGGHVAGSVSSRNRAGRQKGEQLSRLTASKSAFPWPRQAKLHVLEQLLERHRGDRTLVFTYDNATVYQIARRFLVPAITHQTKTKERRRFSNASIAATIPSWLRARSSTKGWTVPAATSALSCLAQAASASTSSAWADCCASMATSRPCSTR